MVTLLVHDKDDSSVGYLVFTVYSQEVSMCKHKKTFVYIQSWFPDWASQSKHALKVIV